MLKGFFFKTKDSKKTPVKMPMLALDIENNPRTGEFILAHIFGDVKVKENGYYRLQKVDKEFRNREELTTFLLNLKHPALKRKVTTLVLFNAAYDLPFLFDITNDNETLYHGGRIITSELKNGIKVIDLTNFVDGSLEYWINELRAEMKGIEKKSLDNLSERCEYDAKATYVLGMFIQDFITDVLGIPMKTTISSQAREFLQQKFLKEEYEIYRSEQEQWLNEKERESYRGGRTECFIRGEISVKSYDVNSMYLSIMRDCLMPFPNSVKYKGRAYYKRRPVKLPQKLYIAKCLVKTTKKVKKIGVLPYVRKDKRLIFPRGVFEGCFCSPELDYAVKNGYVEVLKIYWTLEYDGFPLFKDIASYIWRTRLEYKKKNMNGFQLMIKKIGNSLYGGFGQRNKKVQYIGKVEDCSIDNISKDAVPVLNVYDKPFICFTGNESEDSKHTFPCIASFISSYARLKMLKALLSNEEAVVYCDTDSIKIKSDKTLTGCDIGNDLGEWGFEYEQTEIFYRSKFYANKMKGVPKKHQVIFETPDLIKVVYEKPNKIKESIKRKLIINKWSQIEKILSKSEDKRLWYSDIKTREERSFAPYP